MNQNKINFDVAGLMACVRTSVYAGVEPDRPTLREIQNYTGVSASTLSRLDNGKLPGIETLIQLCEVCDLNPSQFFKTGGRFVSFVGVEYTHDSKVDPENDQTGIYTVYGNGVAIWQGKGARGRDIVYALVIVLNFAARALVNPPAALIVRYNENITILKNHSSIYPELPEMVVDLIEAGGIY